MQRLWLDLLINSVEHIILVVLELLAPVGSPASLKAAVLAGADSVYMGSLWNARMRARNFSKEELAQAIAYCRKEGVKSYITLNTLIFESELKLVEDYIKFVYEYGADALIVQDLAAAAIAREIAPELELHASTQMSTHNSRTASKLKSLGFKRLILARELSLQQAESIRKNAGIEVEVFCHGALCYSYSGRCLLSKFQTGRSGNRGMCAHLCRLPWRVYCSGKETKRGYLTSTKDLSTIESVPEIAKSSIDCIKIEGRLKDAGYVRTVVSAYRKAIDTGKMDDLSKLTARTYTQGYLFGKARTEKLTNPAGQAFSGARIGEVVSVSQQGARVRLTNTLKIGDSLRTKRSGKILEIYRIYENEQEVPQSSRECLLKIKTLKKGDVLLKVERAEIEDSFLKEVIPMRVRNPSAFTRPSPLKFQRFPELFYAQNKGGIFEAPKESACVLPWHSIDDEALSLAKRRGLKLVIDTPRIAFDEELPSIDEKMRELAETKPLAFMASDPSLVGEYPTILSTYANLCNSLAALEWSKFGNVKAVVASTEIEKKNAEAIGFIPYSGDMLELMISENDLLKEMELPANSEAELVDPKGNKFQVKKRFGRTIVYAPKSKERL